MVRQAVLAAEVLTGSCGVLITAIKEHHAHALVAITTLMKFLVAHAHETE